MSIEDTKEPCIHDYFRVVQVATGKYRVQQYEDSLKKFLFTSLLDNSYPTMGEAAHEMHHRWRAHLKMGLITGPFSDCKKSFEITRILSREEAACTEEELEVTFTEGGKILVMDDPFRNEE